MDDSERIIKELQKLNERIEAIGNSIGFLTVVVLIVAFIAAGYVLAAIFH